MDGYLVIKGPEPILEKVIAGLRAAPPPGWLSEEFDASEWSTPGLTAANFLIINTPEIGDRCFELSLIIDLGRLQINTIIPIELRYKRGINARERRKVVHRFFKHCIEDFLELHPELEIESLQV